MMTPVLAQFGSPTHWLIFLIVVLVVFGARRLPEVARSLGKSMGEFKKARREFEEELMKAEKKGEGEAPAGDEKDKKEEAP
ncbi:MAG: twin-arginine translocase TatA/TatE family subunit [Akkermansia sp.]|nr:twin-arginine translocase TatA/TatE family subunit [Akkermansia sp.]